MYLLITNLTPCRAEMKLFGFEGEAHNGYFLVLQSS